MSAIIYLSIFFLITSAISFNNGSFVGNLSPIFIIFSAFLVLLYFFFYPKKNEGEAKNFPVIILIPVVCFFALVPGGWWIKNDNIIKLIQIVASFLLLPTVFFVKNNQSKKSLFAYLWFFLGFAFILRLLIILGSPGPAIDVYAILKEAPLKLFQAINPYDTLYTYVFPNVNPDYYAYWPASFLLELPFIVVFNDPRYLMLIADLGSALILFYLGGKTVSSLTISLLYLFRPMSLSIIEASWLTPLDFFFICLIAYSIYKLKKPVLVGILLGILTSIQFFFVFLFFFLIRFFRWNKKFIISFFLTTAVFVTPFFLLNPTNFWNQTINVYFRHPPHPSILIHTSLNLNTLFYVFTNKDLPPLLIYTIILVIFLLSLMPKKKDYSPFTSFTLLLFAVFVFGRQAFINYYYLIASLILLILTLKISQKAQTNGINQ